MQIFRRPLVALLIALVLCLVIFAAGYFLLVGPKKGEIDKKQKEIEGVENNIRAEKATYQELLNIKNNSATYEAKLAHLQSVIPQEPQLASLIRNLQAAADPGTGAGLPWLSFAPGEIATGANSAEYSSYTFTMKVGGFYDEVTDLVYRMERFSRAVVIDSVSIVSSTGFLERKFSEDLGVVTADITARAFTFTAPEGAAGQSATTTPTPGSEATSTSPTSTSPTSTTP
jgi:Tfp pilus assembly protein PilO